MSNPSKTAWLQEPLLHFLLLGALIFVLDALLNPSTDDSRIIKVDENVREMLTSKFYEGQGRAPTRAEYEQLVHRWIQNEVMYREALALGLDQGDEMIRSRIILKMRNLVFGNIVVDTPPEDALRAWFEANREHYDLPRRFDFVQFRIPDAHDRAQAQALASNLANGAVPKEYRNLIRRYKNRPRSHIAGMFGEDFAAGLLEPPSRDWRPLPSAKGWHMARVEAVRDAVPASFEAHRARVEADWRMAQQKASVFKQLKEIRERYDIRREDQQ